MNSEDAFSRAQRGSVAVIAIVATFRRPFELQRLLQSLESSGPQLRSVVIVDNAGDAETKSLAAASQLDCRVVAPGRNLGCAGGLKAGETAALEMFREEFTHFWILDDDAVVRPDTLRILLGAMEEERAWAAIPLVVDKDGRVGWFPHVFDRAKFDAMKRATPLEEFRTRFGCKPELFTWCTGVSLLVARAAIEQLGFHRADYWIRGEDLEYSLRLTSHGRGILVPSATVEHLPPEASQAVDPLEERRKHAAMLRNIAFTGFRLRHGRRLLRNLPGNWWRFLRTWGIRPGTALELLHTFWLGAIRGLPAGVGPGAPQG